MGLTPSAFVVGREFPSKKKNAVCRVVGFAPFDMASPVVLTVTIQPLAISVHGSPTLRAHGLCLFRVLNSYEPQP